MSAEDNKVEEKKPEDKKEEEKKEEDKKGENKRTDKKKTEDKKAEEKMSKEIEQLEKSLKNKEESLIREITIKYTNAERLKLREKYKNKFGHDILDDIDKNLKDEFKNALLSLYKEPSENDADLLYRAIKGIGSGKDVVTEIVCFRDYAKMNKIKEKFKEKYKKDLVSEIKNEIYGDYQKAIVYMIENDRNKNNNPNVENCKKIAEEIDNPGEKKNGISDFIKYFTSLSPEELQIVCKEYHKKYKKNIVQVIDTEFGGNLKHLLKTILYGLYNPSEYFARKINDALEGAGTANDQLLRCLVTRRENDMKYIKTYYKQIFKKEMLQRVKESTTGEYQLLLEGLIRRRKKKGINLND